MTCRWSLDIVVRQIDWCAYRGWVVVDARVIKADPSERWRS